MKLLKNISFIILSFLVLSACSEEDKLVYNPDKVVKAVLKSPTDLSFTKDDANELISFEWSETNAGISIQIDYLLQFAATETFEEATTLVSTLETSVELKVSEVNNALIAIGLTPEQEATVYCRVISVINDYVDDVVSDVKSYQTTPYETIIDYPMIYVPGAYQGWSPGAENGRLYSYNFDNIYEGIIRITETADNNGQFKITTGPNWDVNYGGVLTATAEGYSGTIGGTGDNMVVSPGTYAFRVDLSAMTIELTKTDYWGIIGAAVGGWGDTDDVIMHYNGQRKYWEATADFVVEGWKFRKNSSWGGDLTGDANGNLVSSGDNISCTAAGTYHVTFDLDNMKYTFDLVQ